MKKLDCGNNRQISQCKNKPQKTRQKKRNQYMTEKTCSMCGAELARPSMHICDSCAWFLKQKHVADL